MIRCALFALLLGFACAGFVPAADAPPASGGKKDEPAKEAPSLPADVLNFYGKVTGTVVSVDSAKVEMNVKVTTAAADPEKNKAPKPEKLAGMTITVTPLAKQQGSTSVLDEAASAYIKGARAGDPVTLSVRASSKGVVFRLLTVPTAAGK